MGAGATPVFVTVDASSRFLYVSDPAHNSVLGFSIQSNSLTAITGSPFAAGSQPLAELPSVRARMEQAIADGHAADDLVAIAAGVVPR